MQNNNQNLTVVRELLKNRDGSYYTSADGKNCFGYVVKGKIHGKEISASFIPKDFGGYGVLDIIFDIADQAELVVAQEEMTDNTGRKTKYTTYKIQTVDEDGVVYSIGVKPQRDSDKSYLQMILNSVNA
ncbi:MAG: hypothetical protein J6Z36_04240 [Clostridia bacterium]|nr:hypothetical protein [Clostridia bacterium]